MPSTLDPSTRSTATYAYSAAGGALVRGIPLGSPPPPSSGVTVAVSRGCVMGQW